MAAEPPSPSNDVEAYQRCLQEADARLGISRSAYSSVWWLFALWNACAVFNVWSRTQQWGFALPLAPDFEKSSTAYAVASIGSIGGAILLCLLLLTLNYHIQQWGRCSSKWTDKVPQISFIAARQGQLIPLLQAAGLL